MSGRAQALMHTRCPSCSTVFRVTSEQLRLKAGKVRCGHCQTVFNAFDQFESAAHSDAPPTDTASRQIVPEASPSEPAAVCIPDALSEGTPQEASLVVATPNDAGNSYPEIQIIEEPEPEPAEAEAEAEAEKNIATNPDTQPAEHDESPEESTLAAREAGLVAARELNETAAYNRWAAGTLASDGLDAFASEPVRRTSWPFVLVSIMLALTLCGQLALHYRGEIVRRLPDVANLYQLLEINIPLPRHSELVAIETSDLQADNARGMFVLNATLRNRATYAQEWPALELTLTDTNDAVVARRVMFAADYLPPAAPAEAFPANGETAVRLWVEAKNIGAAGYRLYIFYP